MFTPNVRYDEAVREAIQSAAGLRRELSARNLACAEKLAHDATYGAVPSVVYAEDEAGGRGNFLGASYKRICADPHWRLRLEKSYTANARVPRATDRRRKESDCCASSDALPRAGDRVVGYQLVRGVLVAQASGGRFVFLGAGRICRRCGFGSRGRW